MPSEDVDEVQADWKKASLEEKKQMVWDVRKLLDDDGDGDDDDADAPKPKHADAPKPPPKSAPPPPKGGYKDDSKSEVRRRGGGAARPKCPDSRQPTRPPAAPEAHFTGLPSGPERRRAHGAWTPKRGLRRRSGACLKWPTSPPFGHAGGKSRPEHEDLEYDFERAPDGGDWDEYYNKEAKRSKGGRPYVPQQGSKCRLAGATARCPGLLRLTLPPLRTRDGLLRRWAAQGPEGGYDAAVRPGRGRRFRASRTPGAHRRRAAAAADARAAAHCHAARRGGPVGDAVGHGIDRHGLAHGAGGGGARNHRVRDPGRGGVGGALPTPPLEPTPDPRPLLSEARRAMCRSARRAHYALFREPDTGSLPQRGLTMTQRRDV